MTTHPTRTFVLGLVTLAAVVYSPRVSPAAEPAPLLQLVTDVDGPQRDWVVERLTGYRYALDALVLAVSGVRPRPTPMSVLLYRDAARYGKHVAEHAPTLSHNGGYYDGADRRVVSYLEDNPLQVLFHEIAHAVMADVFDDPTFSRYAHPRWPIWLDEGLAEYLSSFRWEGDALRFGVVNHARVATLAGALEEGELPPLSALLKATAARFSEAGNTLYYALSWAMVDYMVRTPALHNALRVWIGRLRQGEDGFSSFLATVAPDPAQLEVRLRAHIRALDRSSVLPETPISPYGLDAWTSHGGGRWTLKDAVVRGETRTGWAYLTRSVPRRQTFDLQVRVRRDGGTVGLVLGDHSAGDYPYHTLISVESDRLSVRHSLAADAIKVVGRRPAASPPGAWVSVGLSLIEGAVSVRIDGRPVLVAPAGRDSVSLIGFYVDRGAMAFKGLRLLDGRKRASDGARP